MKKFDTLYKRDTNKRIQVWTLFVDNDGYFAEEGLEDGKKTTAKPHTCLPKNPGKKNATTAEEQALKEAQAKFDHKLAHGYSRTKQGADETTYLEPMLAKQYEDYKDGIVFPVWVDNKLNGVRLNAIEGVVKSRRGKLFNTIPHIVKSIAPLFEEYPDLFLDGELFNPKLKNHLNRLIELASVAYKPEDLTPELLAESEQIVQFHVYDGYGFEDITPETPFELRRLALQKLLKDIKYVNVLEFTICKNDSEVKALLKQAEKNNDEGIIIRHGSCPYEHKRSKYLLKAKNFKDAEYEIEDIEEGNADWTGHAKRIILKLSKPITGRDGKAQTNFASNIEGDRAYLQKLLKNKKAAIGKFATVRYLELSEYGVPQIPYVVAIRAYE